MKRIVKCPKCEAKLAVFDLGKPINQKCPKCGNAFVIESESQKPEENKAEPAKAPATEPVAPAKTETAAEKTEPAKDTAAKTEKPAAAPAEIKKDTVPAETKKDAVPTEAKKENAPAAEAKKDETPAEVKKEASAKAAEDVKKETPAKDKEIKVKKPEESKAPAAKPRFPAKAATETPDFSDASDLPPAGGTSLFSTAIVVGLLIFVIVIQLMVKVRADKQYSVLATKLERIEAKIQTLK